MAYGTPRAPEEIEAVLHRHPPRPAADRRAARRPDPPLRGDRRPLAAGRDSPRPSATALQAALDERAPGRASSSARPQARRPEDRGGRRRRSPPRASSGSSGSCWRRTTRRCRSASTSAGPARPPTTPGVPFAGVESWATEPAYVEFLAGAGPPLSCDGMPANTKVRVHRPLAAPRASSTPATRTPTSCAPPPRRSPAPSGSHRGRSGRSGGSRPGARPSRGSAPTSSPSSTSSAAAENADGLLVCPCGFVADHLEVLYDLDIEARRRAERHGLAFRPHGVDERRPGRASARSPTAFVADVTRVLVVGGGITGLATAYDARRARRRRRRGDRAARGRRPPRRQAAHVAVRRAAGRRRGRRRLPRPGARTPPTLAARRLGARPDVADRRHGGRLARRAAPDPRGPAARRAGRHRCAWRRSRPAVACAASCGPRAEPLLPRRGDPDDSIGALVRGRFGDEVHERLVDALVGSIYAADTDRFSLAMVPAARRARRARSQPAARRPGDARGGAAPRDGPLFLAPRRAWPRSSTPSPTRPTRAGRDDPRPGPPVASLAADGAGVAGRRRPVRRRRAGDARRRRPRRCSPAPRPEAARLLATMDHAGVVIVTLAVADWPERLRGRSGYLVPKPVQRTVTAASFGSQKWAHWRRRATARCCASRSVATACRSTTSTTTSWSTAPSPRSAATSASTSSRRPCACRAGPAASRSTARTTATGSPASIAALPAGLVVTGASYGGIGVPACIAQAERDRRATSTALLRV